MAIYPVFKTLITGVAIASVALVSAGCNQLGDESKMGAESAAAVEATGGTATDDSNTGVSTNHDIYHARGMEVPAGRPVPAVTVRVESDSVQGWNLYVGTANFDFLSPAKIGGESSPTAGHAYLYINDEPIQRLYGSWTHLPELPAGNNEIRVTLNANSHETLTTQNEPIEDSVMIEVYSPNATGS